MRRFLAVLGVVALMVASVEPAAAADPSRFNPVDGGVSQIDLQHLSKTSSGRLAQSDPDLLARTDSKVIPILVKVDVDPVASYHGGVERFAATSPSDTGKALKENGAAVSAYKGYVTLKLGTTKNAATRAVPGLKPGRNFTVAYGGFAASIPANQAKQLLKVPGVAAVQYDSIGQPTANDSPDFVGASAVWPSLGGENKAGQGVKVGVLDTGIWPEHPMLADPGIPNPGGGPYACEFGLSGEAHDDAFVCNDKLIGAYAFLDTNVANTTQLPGEYCPTAANCSARDADGHGTHTSTTAAGSPVDHSVLLGVDRGHISGIAPGASVIMYRVCDSDGCFGSDSMAAVEQAINDDIDVINFSISGGANAYTDGVELAFLDAVAAGIEVNASAGNSGPGSATSDHAGPWTNTVGASTLNREFGSTLHLTADGGATLDLSGATVTGGVTSPTAVVLGSATASGELCDTAAPGGTYTGVVVACRRGGNARIEKGYNVLQGGAVGMILYNVAQTDKETDNHFLPAIHVNDPSETIAAFVTGHTNVMATWAAGTAGPAQGDVMASFSSRGPVGDFIKPDVTAPGVQILAGESPWHLFSPADGLGPNGEYYQAIAGTSMSSPHAAGVAALIKAAHPSWTPMEIKSAMMTSSLQSVVKEDGSTPADPFDRGAGSIRANRAVSPTGIFDIQASAFYAAVNDPFARINLNLPSINAPIMSGQITTSRTITNATNTSQTFNVTTKAPNNSKITVTPSSFTVAPYGKYTFQVKIDGQKLADGQYFGQITLDPSKSGYNNVVLPVAFFHQPGSVTVNNSCTPPTAFVAQSLTMTKGQTAQCQVTVTNFSNETAHTTTRVKAPNTDRLIIKNWSAGNKKGNGFIFNSTLTPAGAPPIVSFAPALDSPAGGYLPLSLFGITPIGGMTDEALANYNVPTYSFGHELYDRIMVDSNGYLVVGGGTGDDHSYSPTGLFPGTARPNNVLAPYWTDLNPGAAGAVRIGTLTDGVTTWLVVDWEGVPVFGTANYRSFQAWITIGGTSSEGIWFEYGASGAGDATAHLQAGAENRDGSSAKTLGDNVAPVAATSYKVVAGSPIAGGSQTVTYDAFGKRTGIFDVKAIMTSDVTQGSSYSIVKIKVVNP